MEARQRAALGFYIIVLLAVSGVSATRESSIGRLPRTGGMLGRRSMVGWTAQRKLQGVDLASASAFATASSSVIKKPEVVKETPIVKKPQVKVVKQPEVVKVEQPKVVKVEQPKVVKVPKIVKQPQVVVKKVYAPPPPEKKVIALKKFG